MTTVTESLRPITRTDISADILNDISADYALMRYESYTSCKNAGAKKTDLGQYLCDTYKDLKHPNILFIYLESFRAIDLGAYGGDGKVSQGFDELAKEDARRSNGSLLLPARNYGISMMRIYRENNYDCLPSVLKRAGYSTSFIFASNAGFDQQDTFFPKIGIDKIIDEVEFPLGSERLGWGYTDEVMFTKLLEVLDKEPQPFFSSALTSTNHHPFDVPDEYQKGAREYSEKYFETMLYTSDQLYKFIREAQKRDWYKNSIIFIFADHANNQPSKYHDAAYRRIGSENTASAAEQDHQGYLEVNYKIPLLVMGGLITQAMTEEAVSSEIDLPVTVADYWVQRA
ncbi:hypothetical protein CHS0354_030112 [Potamilus streckersoni]|uniref:Sulfatase N-terminal domain-containing protein n=1 Tax=Potamilus streckersoni TaxID=2493646 RepID=A0AAE0RLX1_9BIVA|nr:hypothetical protein CHS0354_030112 [Potamilus streckersoni]